MEEIKLYQSWSELVFLFRYWLTWAVLDKGPLTGLLLLFLDFNTTGHARKETVGI